jgi:hypothetical protein
VSGRSGEAHQGRLGTAEDVPGDDRLEPLTVVSFAPLAVASAIAGPALVLLPGSTDQFWAWEIRPDLSAVYVGAGYTFGATTIALLLAVGRWRAALVPVVTTWPFAVVMLMATLVHRDRFFDDRWQFWVWSAIYAYLPFALPVLWWRNRRRDPGPRPDDVLVAPALSRVGLVAGIPVALLALLLVLSPSVAADVWPWPLTPLMSRVIGGWLLFIATGTLALFVERRYVAYRWFLASVSLWFGLLFVASLVHRDELDFDRALTWLWFPLVAVTALAPLAVLARHEPRWRAAGERPQAPVS